MDRKSRLVVTGHDPDGRAVFTADGDAPVFELPGGVRASLLWGRDDIATFPDSGERPAEAGAAPAPGGCRFSTLTIPAGADRDYHAFIVQALGNLADPAEPGFHRTPSLDFVYVVSGEITLELDEGVERRLSAGDTAVLNGVRHRWHNRGTQDTTIVAVMIGANVLTV
jgi:mannose-6-phosphate isomerase-like protein (cupin superfamily)